MGDGEADPDGGGEKEQTADGSELRTWARGLYTMMGGEPSNFDAAWDDVLGGEQGHRIDDLAARGIGLGGRMAQAQQRRRGAPQAEGPAPKVHMREIHVDGEFLGLRVLSTDEKTKVYAGDGELFIVTDAGQEPHPIGFDVGQVCEAERESMAEFLVLTRDAPEGAVEALLEGERDAEGAEEADRDGESEGDEGDGAD